MATRRQTHQRGEKLSTSSHETASDLRRDPNKVSRLWSRGTISTLTQHNLIKTSPDVTSTLTHGPARSTL